MKFNEYVYLRPDYEVVKKEFIELLDGFKQSNDGAEQRSYFKKINQLRLKIESMSTLSSIRHSINTQDPFYEAENDYWDNQNPLYTELNMQFYHAVLNSEFLQDLKDVYPVTFFQLAENALKTFKPEIIELLQEENKLVSEYYKLMASAQIEFDGGVYTLSQLTPFTQNPNRDTRKRAFEARTSFLIQNEANLDKIYDDLVKVRTKIAHELGFENYIPLGYLRMNRLDYDAKMVSFYREQVLEYVVPLAQKLYKKQASRLGLDKLAYYDINFDFKSGNPTPKASPAEMVQIAKEMYHELSPETGEFFDFMVEHDLLDLESKKGKQGGGYCTYIPEYVSPFIFSNFNATAGDVEVLTHEAGHAFQVYQSRWVDVPECAFPTYESCEIHSMSMEYLTWPWMDRFFKEDTDKFKYAHMSDNVKFLPYGVSVDHFQHEVYANPNLTPEERKAVWRKLEKMYVPHKDYTENPFLDKGTFWYNQGHIFSTPFYYIDYTLAGVCAMQFWKRATLNDPNTFKDYLSICNIGGTKSFVNIVKDANLISPFEKECIPSIIKDVEEFLYSIDDTKL